MSSGDPDLGRPKRPAKLPERAWLWAPVAAGVAVLCVAAALLFLKHIRDSGGARGRGAFWLVTTLGVVAALLIGSTFFYTLRKRRRRFQERMPGSMMAWFKSHIYLGVLALVVALVHVLTRPWTSPVTTGKITLLVLLVLVVSGVAWRVVYLVVPPRVAGAVGNLAIVDTDKRLEEVGVELDKLTAGASPEFRAQVAARLEGKAANAAALPPHEQALWPQVEHLASRRERYLRREARQRGYARLLQWWKLAHIPLATILFGLIAVHVLDVFGAGRAAFGGDAKQFPASASCASCHSVIARQWHRSVMSHAVTSPVMIAQTALALKMNPSLGQFCVNCHGPVGATITGNTTLPFEVGVGDPTDPQGGNPHDLILAEGVSCVVCHALDAAPAVGSGAAPFRVNTSGLTSLGAFTGPPLTDPPPVPVPDHQIVSGGYMATDAASSQLCGACHVVHVDLNGDGAFSVQDDLVLQTTFQEWRQRYVRFGGTGTCISCHMPGSSGPIVNGAPFLGSAPDREIADHSFVGVDYDLTPGHPGQSDADFGRDLSQRAVLLRSAASLQVDTRIEQQNGGRFLVADVTVTNVGAGHQLPTGFAFVRQMWLEVSATDSNGNEVCLSAVLPGGGPVPIRSSCASGRLDSPQEDLRYCDPLAVARAEGFGVDPAHNSDVRLARGAAAGLDDCDPWLAGWQKILTDGPPLDGKVRREVGYQSPAANIVETRVRVADQQVMGPMDPFGARQSETFPYFFGLNGIGGEEVTVTATLHFRHLPPYFLRELDGFYPPGVTVGGLLRGLTVVDMATARARVAL